MSTKIKCMKDLEIFSALSDEEKKLVVRLAKPAFVKKGEEIFSEGMDCDKIYFIRKGKILLYKVSEDGQEMALDILNQDDIFGENTIFDESVHSFSAKAKEDTYICVCSREDFLELLKNPLIAMKMMKFLLNKLNGYTEQMANIAFNDVRGRIEGILGNLSTKHGIETADGVKIDVVLGHQDIANLVNASRVMVTNVLNTMKAEEAIAIEQRYIYVKDKDLLRHQMA